MIRTICCIVCVFLLCISMTAAAQNMIDSRPYDPEVDPDIDMFISDWRESTPRKNYGSLVERDIFTPCTGDPLKPTTRGAVLTDLNRFSFALLQKRTNTTPFTPEDEQIIFYIVSGKGSIKGGSKTYALHPGVMVLVPEGIEFTLMNPGDEVLKMYLVAEPVPPGFTPLTELFVKDENTMPITTTHSHWYHILKAMFTGVRGNLATLVGFCPVWLDPMTMGNPHSHVEKEEEIWFVLEGEVIVLLGKELRRLKPGMAFKVPPNGTTPHSSINVSDEQIKLVWFMVIRDYDRR